MAKIRITAGQKVRFDPFLAIFGFGIDECRGMVVGTVVKVYPDHKWFSVALGTLNSAFPSSSVMLVKG
jgi:hypothetical protein